MKRLQPISEIVEARRDCSQHLPYWKARSECSHYIGGKKWLQSIFSDNGGKERLRPMSGILKGRWDEAIAVNIWDIGGKNWLQPISKIFKARSDCSQHLPYWRLEANAANVSDIGGKKRWSHCCQYLRYWRQEGFAVNILRHWRLVQPLSQTLEERRDEAIGANIWDIGG